MGTTRALSDSEEEVIFNPFEAYFNIGRHLLSKREYKRALVYLDKAPRLYPNGELIWLVAHARNMSLSSQERPIKLFNDVPEEGTNNDESIELAKAAHAITKRNPHAILLIAEGYYRKGEFEMALKYFINDDVNPKLWPEMNLTDYYSYAFPPKNTSNSQTLNLQKVSGSVKSTADTKKSTEKWPEMMPAETLRKVFDKKYSEYLYIHELYRVEGKRAEFLKNMGMSHLDDLHLRIDRCRQNRQIVRDCAYCLRAKADLWHKIDPSMKHTTSF